MIMVTWSILQIVQAILSIRILHTIVMWRILIVCSAFVILSNNQYGRTNVITYEL